MTTDAAIRRALDCGRQGCTCSRGRNTHCPGPSHANGDRDPSLTVHERDGKVLVNCKGPCSQDDVIAALQDRGLWPRRNGQSNGHVAAPVTVPTLARHKGLPGPWLQELGLRDVSGGVEIPYFDTQGREMFARRRTALRAKDGTKQPAGVKLIPYGLDRLDGWAGRSALLLVEGESDCWAGWHHGLAVLGIPGASAAGCLERAAVEPFDELFVTVEPDAGGQAFGPNIRRRLDELGWTGTVYAVELHHDGRRIKDLADLHLAVGGDRAAFWSALKDARERAVPLTLVGDHDDGLITLNTLITQGGSREQPWPAPLDDAAYYGPLGELVRAVAPHTEADPIAILGHLASAIGVYLGKSVRAYAGDAAHPARLNVLVVGETSAGRKGTARSVAERLLRIADEAFVAGNVTEGLSSGEGVIWEVRDEIRRMERVGTGKDARYEERLADPGVEDKRRWIVESEFASVRRVAQRDGSTLSATLRQAWDRDDLRSMTKNNPARATGAHVAITGHISRDELLRYLDRSELAGGLINRFLLIAARRSRLLPDGDLVPEAALVPFARCLLEARAWATTPRVMRRDDGAHDAWHEVYGALTRTRPGIFGAATGRAEAQVLRLSVLYAALDRSEQIHAEHLLAALAVWRYAEQSARWIFGDATGDPTADAILSALRRGDELGRNEIYELLGRRIQRSRIEQALGLLLDAGLATTRREPTDGRPREVWRAT